MSVGPTSLRTTVKRVCQVALAGPNENQSASVLIKGSADLDEEDGSFGATGVMGSSMQFTV
jgi:hypothetical protein